MAADEKNKVGTPGEFAFRDDDRRTPYGRPRRSGMLGFLLVAALIGAGLVVFIATRTGEAPRPSAISGEAVRPR